MRYWFKCSRFGKEGNECELELSKRNIKEDYTWPVICREFMRNFQGWSNMVRLAWEVRLEWENGKNEW